MKIVRICICLLVFQMLSGCVTGGGEEARTAAEGQVHYTAREGLTPKQRFREALQLLESGEPMQARVELVAYLSENPGSEVASSLLQQIDTPSEDFFPEAYLEVQLKAGESLSTLARDYLGDVYQFYALAKYNGIDKPRNIKIGANIRIPQTEFAQQAFAKRASGQELLPAAESPDEPEAATGEPAPVETTGGTDEPLTEPGTGGESEVDDQFARLGELYREALDAYRAQKLDKAIALWDQVLAVDPNYENARLYRSQAIELRKKLTQIN